LILAYETSKYSDIWSLGIILYEIIYKKHPLRKENQPYTKAIEEFLSGATKISYPTKPGFEKLIDLIKQMLVASKLKVKRLSWEELGTAIYNHLGIHPRVTIVSNIGEFVDYATNVNTLISGLLYYIEQNDEMLK